MDFLDLSGPFSLCLAARIWAVSRPVLGCGRPGVFGSFRSPWGGTAAAGGCVRGRRAARTLATFAGAIFWSERWSGSQSACAVAGAGARARPGGGLPTRPEPVAEPSGLGGSPQRADRNRPTPTITSGVLANTLERRAAYPSTCAVGEHTVRARPDRGAACPLGAGGRAVPGSGCRHSALRCGVALLLLAALFWLERWRGSQSACAVAGAGARARPGGGAAYPFGAGG